MSDPLRPSREWWTTAEMAEAAMPDLPRARQAIEKVVKRQGWRADVAHARRRSGRGGGWEYHWTLLPVRAQRALLGAGSTVDQVQRAGRDEAWAWFDGLPEKVKATAARRLSIIQKCEALVGIGQTKSVAVNAVSGVEGVTARSIWAWFSMIEGVRADDRLPHLAPRHRAAPRSASTVEIDVDFMRWMKSDYLRLAGPSFATCYRRAMKQAARHGWSVPVERTLRRHFDAEVSQATQVLARKGVDALKSLFPSQTRDKTALRALEVVNGDFHRFDVFVRWPTSPGQNEPPYIGRPQMVAFQDVFSGRILAWRVDQTPNAEAVRLVAGDMIEDWGIPEHILLDNGREFAAKALTGGTPTRYRFKVREDDIPGLFVALGCEIHWATPYSGQSKPIERAFRDMCDAISKDPRFQGAYTGNRPDAQPEDYGSRAVDLDEFLRVVAEGIEEHNTRVGRRSEVAHGRSFAEAFDESYATAPIRKATAAQRRLWLMGAEGLRADTKTGLIRFQGNEYWDAWMGDISGQRVIVRFDPAALWDGLHIYAADNRYLGYAPCKAKVGFLDVAEARAHAKVRGAWLKAEREVLAAHKRLTAAQLGAMLEEAAIDASAPISVEAKVVRPVFGKAADKRADAAATGHIPAEVARHEAERIVTDLAARRPAKVDNPERERFRRALELERAIEAGIPATADQQRWLASYQQTSEYRIERSLWEEDGDAIFG